MDVVVVAVDLYEAEINLHDAVNIVSSVDNAVLELELAVRAEGIGSGREQTVCLACIDINSPSFYSAASVNVIIIIADLNQAIICAKHSFINISQTII